MDQCHEPYSSERRLLGALFLSFEFAFFSHLKNLELPSSLGQRPEPFNIPKFEYIKLVHFHRYFDTMATMGGLA
jgi:hypothetical protein